ncbi:MAG: ABC transporter substrate-binding protein, partial [Chloroflexi bacterium]|nr:ABC transporter substrate-binding protein [Chloroflexota bacterium]
MKRISLLCLVIALAALVSCAPPAPSAPAAASVKLSDNKLVIAVINDQSGVYADLGGKNSIVAVQMAVDDFKAKYGENALGGSVEIISADHQNKPDVASSKTQEFIDRNGADLILDVPTSSAALAIRDVVKDKKRIYINIGAATTDLTGKDCNKYTFHYAYDTYMLAAGTGTYVTQNVGKKWYIIYPNYAFGQDMDKSFRAAITANGGTVLASDPSPFPNQTGDFSSLLLKAPSLKPEILGAMQAGGDLVNVVKQYNEFKLKDQGIKLAIGLLFDTDIKALGVEAFQGVVYTTPWIWNQDDASKAWADKFKAKTGVRPTFDHAGNYSAATQYLE